MLKIDVRSQGNVTVSEMRRILARHLSNLDGNRLVSFDFFATIPTPPTCADAYYRPARFRTVLTVEDGM